jgi:photoactive yellow protein
MTTLDRQALERRLFALETKRAQIDREIRDLRATLEEVPSADRLAPTGTFGSAPPPTRRRAMTQPYVVSASDRAVDAWETPARSNAASELPSLVPSVGLPELAREHEVAEPLADFDPGALRSLPEEELDALPYGLVILDAEGNVLRYNDTESSMVGLPPEKVEGRNFFRDIAPCTRVRQFEGRFREFARTARSYSVETFDFVFRFARQTQHVTIYLTPGRQRGTFNVAMLRRKVERR